jgi:hypothetical protein
MKNLTSMGIGMYPLNYASRLVKAASDVMFSIALNEEGYTLTGLENVEKIAAELRKAIQETRDDDEKMPE